MRADLSEYPVAQGTATSFLAGVYGWMAVGLGVTAAVAFGVASTPAVVAVLATHPALLWGLFLTQLILVVILSRRVSALSPTTAGGLFILYAALTGVTFSLLLLEFTDASVAAAFVAAASMFGAMAVVGLVTRTDLSRFGSFLAMALVGLVLSSVAGIFWRSSALQFGISVAGVVIFTGLTAWDSQRLSAMAREIPPERQAAFAVVGALTLYLDFVNLFISLLTLFGRRRDD